MIVFQTGILQFFAFAQKIDLYLSRSGGQDRCRWCVYPGHKIRRRWPFQVDSQKLLYRLFQWLLRVWSWRLNSLQIYVWSNQFSVFVTPYCCTDINYPIIRGKWYPSVQFSICRNSIQGEQRYYFHRPAGSVSQYLGKGAAMGWWMGSAVQAFTEIRQVEYINYRITLHLDRLAVHYIIRWWRRTGLCDQKLLLHQQRFEIKGWKIMGQW